MDDCELSGFPSPAWTNLLDSDAIHAIQRAQPVTLALPCIGIDACSQALVDMRVPFVVKHAYDIQACLARPLTALHGDISHFHLGHIDGDLLAADIHAWERVDGAGLTMRQAWQLDRPTAAQVFYPRNGAWHG